MGQEKSKIVQVNIPTLNLNATANELRGTQIKKPKTITNSNNSQVNYFQDNEKTNSKKTDKNILNGFSSQLPAINDKMLLSTDITNDSSVTNIDPKTMNKLNNFFQGLDFPSRYLILEYLCDDLYKLIIINRKWRRAIKELLTTIGLDTAKRFVSKNKEYINQYNLDLRFVNNEKVNRVDLLLNLKFNETLKNKRVIIEYSYKLLDDCEINYCNFEFNLNDSLHNRLYVFYEHSRLYNQNSSLWSSVNHNYSYRSTISIPIILNSNSEFINIRSIKWQKLRVGIHKPESAYETEMAKNFKDFKWKPLKNEFLVQLLPTRLLRSNFDVVSQAYHGLDTVILKAEYMATKKGKIMIYDETDNKNHLNINIYDKNEQTKVVNIMKPLDIIKDVEETLNLKEGDLVIFYIKKNFDEY